MIKAVLFDVDGVVFRPRDKYFSQRLREEGKDIPEEKVLPFFKKEYKKVVVGKADLKEEVKKYLDDWKWKGTADELLDYWFYYENKINEEVIELAQNLKKEGIKCYLASDHSRYRTDDFWNNVGLKKYFDGVFSSGHLGCTKEDENFFEKVRENLQLEKEEILFVDDDPENVKVAERVGLRAVCFENNADSVEELKSIVLGN